jgi:hypothetical protein
MSKRFIVTIRLAVVLGLSLAIALITKFTLTASASRWSWRLNQVEIALAISAAFAATAYILYQIFVHWIEPRIPTVNQPAEDTPGETTNHNSPDHSEFGRYNPLHAALGGIWGTFYSILGVFASLSIGYLIAEHDYWSISYTLVGSGVGGIGMVLVGSLAPIMIPALAYTVIRCVIMDRDQLVCFTHLTLLQSFNCALSSHREINVVVIGFALLVFIFDSYIVWSLRKAALGDSELPVGFIRHTNGLISLFALFMIGYVVTSAMRSNSNGIFDESHSQATRLAAITVITLPCAILLCFAAIDTLRTFKKKSPDEE